MYSGFQSTANAIYEVGWQWTQSKPQWALYVRVAGDSGSGYAPGTQGQWVNGWKMNSATFASDVPMHVNSNLSIGTDGLRYITSAISTSVSNYVVGIRSDNPSITFTSLWPENSANVYVRKLVSLAKSSGTWDTSSHINLAKYRNSTFTRDTIINNWPNYGCTYERDGFPVLFDSASPLYGDTVSIHQ
ncbi:hypothetical protein [Deinococcus ruber]|uniref:Uncharacterized protein n=1 Tax=Deinococcus ruber TaxID=1848197 RepID=A0A918FIZ3_9DEIO|nr:hypothetical protein [Deinococcus ruber]GGR40493.1 hypothetical protein GCM10008957_56180 [Deinococcus ruber]